MNKIQWITFMVFLICHFFCGALYLLPVTFYPSEAMTKGATASEYGVVLGIFDITAFIVSVLLMRFVNTIGSKFLCVASVFTLSISNLLFGLVNLIYSRESFLVTGIAIRIVAGASDCAYLVSSISITQLICPENAALIFSFLESSFGVGLITGPLLGLILYNAGGFLLPFAVTGGLLFCISSFVTVNLKILLKNVDLRTSKTDFPYGLLRKPYIVIFAFGLATCFSGLLFVEIQLTMMLIPFNLSRLETGGVLIITPALYVIFSPLYGLLLNKGFSVHYTFSSGALLCVIAYILLWYASFLQIKPELWLIILGLFCQGIGVSCLSTVSFRGFMEEALKGGYPDDLSTFGIISSLWTAFMYLGCSLGPIISGILIDSLGLPGALISFFSVQLLSFVCHGLYFCIERKDKQKFETL